MQHSPFSAAVNNLPSYKSYNYQDSSEDSLSNEASSNTLYRTSISDSADNFFKYDFNWEYFSNELEFE